MNQKPRTIDDQIKLLQLRGLQFSNLQLAKEQLSRISYFRLKYYWKDLLDFEVDEDPMVFIEGANFNHVIRRYDLDYLLRHALFTAVEIIEVALRTKFIQHLSQMEGHGLWYLDSNLFENKQYHKESVLDLKYEFSRSTEPYAREFIQKHSQWDSCSLGGENPDAWMIIESATFGTLSKLYKNLKNQLPAKSAIAKDFGLYSSREFSNWIETIAIYRNVIAHHGRMWNRTFGKQLMNIHGHRDSWILGEFTDNQRRKPYAVMTAMVYLCKAVNPDNHIAKQIYQILVQYQDLPLFQIGIPHNWQDEPIWQ